MISTSVFDVSKFGARPGDTNSLNAAWEEIRRRAKLVGSETEIVFPPGYWRCRDPLWVDWNNVTVRGAGIGKTSVTANYGSGSIVFVAGFDRTPGGKSFPESRRPVITKDSPLDGSIEGYGYRLGNGYHLAVQGSIADVGIAQWAGYYDANGTRTEPVRKLTIEVAFAWHGDVPQGVQLCGILDRGLGPWYEGTGPPGSVRPWSIMFDQFDRKGRPVPEFPVLIFAVGTRTGPEPQNERGYELEPGREWSIDLAGCPKDTVIRLVVQVNLDAATVTAAVGDVQVKTEPGYRADEASGWKAGTDLRFSRNECIPFKMGSDGQRLTSGKSSSDDSKGEFTVYGLSVSNNLRYRMDGPGTPLARVDTGTSPPDDHWRYVDDSTDRTAPNLWWLENSLITDCDGRIARIAHGRHSKVNASRDTAFLCDSSNNFWQNPAYAWNNNITFRDMTVSTEGVGTEDRCGSCIAVYETFFTYVLNCRLQGGCYGYQTLRGDCAYPIFLDEVFAQGRHAGIFAIKSQIKIGKMHVGVPNLYGCYFIGCSVTIDQILSSGWNGRYGHALIKSIPAEWAHVLEVREAWDDTEGGPDPVEGLIVMSRADGASTGVLTIGRIECGGMSTGVPLIALRGGSDWKDGISRCQIGTCATVNFPDGGIVHADTPYWEGVVCRPSTWSGRPREPVVTYEDRFRTGIANSKIQILG